MARRSRRGGHGGGHGGGESSERWLLTYADMITLLLALFIVLFAMATVDPAKFSKLKSALSQEFNGQVLEGGSSFQDGSENPLSGFDASQVSPSRSVDIEAAAGAQAQEKYKKTKESVARLAKSKSLKGKIKLAETDRGIVIRLMGDAFFASGSAQILPELRGEIARIAEAVAADDHYIAVEGHTDGAPIATAEFPSNWELSVLRAANVGHELISKGVEHSHLRITGFADTQPVKQPGHPEQSVAENRRVEIVLMSAKAASQSVSSSFERDTPASGAGSATPAPVGQPVGKVVQPSTSVIDPIVSMSQGGATATAGN